MTQNIIPTNDQCTLKSEVKSSLKGKKITFEILNQKNSKSKNNDVSPTINQDMLSGYLILDRKTINKKLSEVRIEINNKITELRNLINILKPIN